MFFIKFFIFINISLLFAGDSDLFGSEPCSSSSIEQPLKTPKTSGAKLTNTIDKCKTFDEFVESALEIIDSYIFINSKMLEYSKQIVNKTISQEDKDEALNYMYYALHIEIEKSFTERFITHSLLDSIERDLDRLYLLKKTFQTRSILEICYILSREYIVDEINTFIKQFKKIFKEDDLPDFFFKKINNLTKNSLLKQITNNHYVNRKFINCVKDIDYGIIKITNKLDCYQSDCFKKTLQKIF